MTRRLITSLLVLTCLSGSVNASSWRLFRSRALGFQLSYPTGWHVVQSNVSGNRSVSFGDTGKSPLSVTVAIAPFKPARSLKTSLSRFVAFQRAIGNEG